MFSVADLSLAAEKMHKNKLVTGGFLKLFQCQSRRFMVFEVGYWKDLQN
jgi:hypothetical protein